MLDCFDFYVLKVSFGLPSMDLDEIMDSDEDIFDIHKRSSGKFNKFAA